MGRSGMGGGSSRGGGGGGGRGSMGRSSHSGRSGISHHSSFHSSSFNYHRPSFYYGPSRGHFSYHVHTGGGAGVSLVNAIFIFIFLAVFLSSIGILPMWNSGSITKSTVDREPLPAGSVQETDYYTDTLFWFGNDTALINGMKHFYQETGVQPYLYITDTVDGSRNPSSSQMEAFAGSLYDELFQDEAHLLLVFQDADGHYTDWVITGSQAKQVVDDEAVNILLDYVDRYYYDSSLDESELFGKSFSMAADRMMDKTMNPLVIVAGAAVVIAIVVAGVYVFKKKQEQKKREDEQMERILNMDINAADAGTSTEVEDLEKKYNKTNSGGN